MWKIIDIGNMQDDISVVMATYNGETYIAEQLDSILAQTLQPKEIIVVDDCSTDKTWSILEHYASANSCIRIFKNKRNLGAHQNFKKAFCYATCDLIAPSDQDDIWRKDKLEVLGKLINEKGVDLVYSQEEILWEDGHREIAVQNMPSMNILMWGNNLKGHTFLFKRHLIEVYTVAHHLSFDYALAMWVCMTGKYASSNEVLSCWRRHPGVMTSFVSDNSELIIEKISRKKKIIYTIMHLGAKSIPIKNSFEDRSKILGLQKEYMLCSRICQKISEQTIMSLFCASIGNIKLNGDVAMWGGAKTKVAHAMWAFRQPWIYWYDMHKLKSIE